MDDVQKDRFDLHGLLEECVTRFLDETVDVSIKASADVINNPVWVTGSYEHLATLTNNLLQNAVAFASTAVIVQLLREQLAPGFSIHDDGPGFADTDTDILLKPFQRGQGMMCRRVYGNRQ